MAWSPVPRDFQILLDCDDTTLCENPPGYVGSAEYDALLDEITLALKESGFNTIVMMGSYKGCEGMMEAALDTIGSDGKTCDIKSIFVLLPRYRESFAAINSTISHFSDRISPKGKQYPSSFLIMDEPQFNDWSQPVFALQYYETKDKVSQYSWNNFTLPCIYLKQWRDRWMFFANLGGANDEYDKKTDKWKIVSLASEKYRSLFVAAADNQEQYLKALQLLFHPAVWSYDQYPFVIYKIIKEDGNILELTFDNIEEQLIALSDNEIIENLDQRTQQFYHFLECFNRQSKETGRPFWAFLNTCAMGEWNPIEKRITTFFPTPTLGMLRYEAFNALALGAQGLVCWMYGMGLSKKFLDKNEYCNVFVDAPMMADVPLNPVPGETKVTLKYRDNTLWQNVKTVINEVRSLERIFLNTEVTAYGHCFPGDTVPEIYLGLRQVSFADGTPSGFMPIMSVTFPTGTSKTNSKHPGILISILKTVLREETVAPAEPETYSSDSGSILPDHPVKPDIPVITFITKRYIVVTNHDALYPQGPINIRFAPEYQITPVFGESAISLDVSQATSVDMTLSPGNMCIFEFSKLKT